MARLLFGRTPRVLTRPSFRLPISHWALILAACTLLLCWLQLSARSHLPAVQSRQQAVQEDAQGSVITGRVDDSLLQTIVAQCMQQQETFIALPAARSTRAPVAVWASAPAGKHGSSSQPACPLLHIPLAAGDRSIGLCTDAALYLQLLGGWISPDSRSGLGSAQRCAGRSAVLFLEPLYEPWLDWLRTNTHVVAAYAPNFEHVFGYDAAAHTRMQLVLCKVRRCEALMRRYLDDTHSAATLIYTGHTSLDPHALRTGQKQQHHRRARRAAAATSGPTRQQHRHQQQHDGSASAAAPAAGPALALAAGAQPLSVLHVRGKSGLKHTKQLLDCWIHHPEWPTLTVLGPLPNEQVSVTEARVFKAAKNIAVPQPGKAQGPDWPAFDPVPAADLSALLLSHAIHIMPSEREGFGHSINEGRGAGAVMLVPDHPPMNELVRNGSGWLLQPRLAFSHQDPPAPVLGKYGNISVSMSAEGICAGVAQVVRLPAPQLLEMGRRARALFEADRADFEDRMRDVRELLSSLVLAATTAAAAAVGDRL